MGYITNFIVYTLAMVGVMVVALIVFKNATNLGGGKNSKYLRVIDNISLGQRKNLYVVSTGKEQFLISSDANSTCLISKLEQNLGENNKILEPIYNVTEEPKPHKSFQDTLASLPKQKYTDKSNVGIHSSLISNSKKSNQSVIKNIAEILK